MSLSSNGVWEYRKGLWAYGEPNSGSYWIKAWIHFMKTLDRLLRGRIWPKVALHQRTSGLSLRFCIKETKMVKGRQGERVRFVIWLFLFILLFHRNCSTLVYSFCTINAVESQFIQFLVVLTELNYEVLVSVPWREWWKEIPNIYYLGRYLPVLHWVGLWNIKTHSMSPNKDCAQMQRLSRSFLRHA